MKDVLEITIEDAGAALALIPLVRERYAGVEDVNFDEIIGGAILMWATFLEGLEEQLVLPAADNGGPRARIRRKGSRILIDRLHG